MLTEQSFDTGEIVINYADGPASGAPLVFLHPSTLHWQNFQDLIPHLVHTWHVYACDLRGHGKSGWATSGYRLVDFIPDTTTFIHRHVGQPAVLLGSSAGALVALGVAARLPELTRAIILIDPPLMLRDTSIQSASSIYPWVTWVYEALTSTQTIEEMVARCKEHAPQIDEAEAQRQAQMLRSVDPQSVAVLLHDQSWQGFALDQVLQQVACPTLLLYGEADRGALVRDADVELVKANLAHSVVIQVRDAGHRLEVEQPARVLGHVTQFLNSL